MRSLRLWWVLGWLLGSPSLGLAQAPIEPVSSSPAHAVPSLPADPPAQPGMGVSIGPVDIRLSGYFRAPLRLSFRSRGDNIPENEPTHSIHTPWLVDDDYFRSGFQYTRLQESDWSEIYLSVGNSVLRGEVALMGSLFSDWARPLIERQWGIAQGHLTFNWHATGERLRFHVAVRGGAFWDRFGWLEPYDTYLFGRTHQLGVQVRLEAELRKTGLSFWLLQGVGAHLDAIEANQGLTLLNYLHAGLDYRRVVTLGFYFLDSQSRDKRQLKELRDALLRVVGVDGSLRLWLGNLYLAASLAQAEQAQYLAPAIEVLHSWGGRGVVENYLGVEKSDGIGSLYSLAADYTLSVRSVLARVSPARLAGLSGSDFRLRFFALTVYTLSQQVDENPLLNRDGRLSFKWGIEGFYQPLSFLFLALRYDRVVLDVQDDASGFRVLSPRVGVTASWLLGAQVFLQYSHYAYGARVRLRPGQVALESLPDDHALKLQAQLTF